MGTAPESGGSFDELPPLDDEWVKKAAKREESAAERSARLRRIASEHDKLQREVVAERQVAKSRHKRDKWRPWIISAAIIAVLALVFVVL